MAGLLVCINKIKLLLNIDVLLKYTGISYVVIQYIVLVFTINIIFPKAHMCAAYRKSISCMKLRNDKISENNSATKLMAFPIC